MEITLHRFYPENQNFYDTFKKGIQVSSNLTDEQIERLWQKYIEVRIDTNDIVEVIGSDDNSHTNIFLKSYYSFHMFIPVTETVDDVIKTMTREYKKK